jgi:glucose-induced degradation protein 8
MLDQLYPDLLKNDAELQFQLQQQHLIELLRKGETIEALTYAQTTLAPVAAVNSSMLAELEQVMTLFAFGDPESSPAASLLKNSHRLRVATQVNVALLRMAQQNTDPKLPRLLKHLKWSQKKLQDHAEFPIIENLVSAEVTDTPDLQMTHSK